MPLFSPPPISRLPRRATRPGFTMLELLIVLVVVGILVHLAVTRAHKGKEKTYQAAMQSDLRNFATARALHVSEKEELPGSSIHVEGFLFSGWIFEASYFESSVTDWMLMVRHSKTPTRCTIQSAANQSSRIYCHAPPAEEPASTFGVTTQGSRASLDATPAIAGATFASLSPLPGALHAASPSEVKLISWEFGDGASSVGPPETHIQTTHLYEKSGEYTATLTLIPNTGTPVTFQRQVQIAGNEAPSADFTAPSEATVGQSVAFQNASSDPDGDLLSSAWEFGDGATATTADATHTYTAPGQYTVTLTVKDPDGLTASASRTITILAQ